MIAYLFLTTHTQRARTGKQVDEHLRAGRTVRGAIQRGVEVGGGGHCRGRHGGGHSAHLQRDRGKRVLFIVFGFWHEKISCETNMKRMNALKKHHQFALIVLSGKDRPIEEAHAVYMQQRLRKSPRDRKSMHRTSISVAKVSLPPAPTVCSSACASSAVWSRPRRVSWSNPPSERVCVCARVCVRPCREAERGCFVVIVDVWFD